MQPTSPATGQTHIREPDAVNAKTRSSVSAAFWILLAFYGAARVLQVYPGRIPMQAVSALHVFPPAIFALIHGARVYRWRGILTFIILCLVVGNIFESVGVRTGFPFGHYYFTELMGPKVFSVPILLGLAYVGMAYLSWILGGIILGGMRRPLTGSRVVTLPLLAAFVMVAWDLSMEPIWATVLRAWVFPGGGAYFGVPISNFAGWYLTVYVLFQGFALYLRGRPVRSAPIPRHHWHQAVLFYSVSTAGNLLLALPQSRFTVVSDSAGTRWNVSDITAVCALVTIFTMGAFTLLGWTRLAEQKEAGAL